MNKMCKCNENLMKMRTIGNLHTTLFCKEVGSSY